ncbi:reverse transcriptase domain-containing protein [Tanacetum coccineum]
MQKLVLALIHAARRLKRYFQAYKITILTNKPIRLLLLKPKKSRRVARWVIELGEHEIEFKPRNVIKEKILVDFLAETQEEDDETDLQSPEKYTSKIDIVWLSWPSLIQWGLLDIVGPYGGPKGKVKFLIIAVDYFTKWVEANPIANVTGKHVEIFMLEHIVEFKRITLTMFHSCTSRSYYRSVSKQTTDRDESDLTNHLPQSLFDVGSRRISIET